MESLESLNKDEQSLLIFFESCMVDYGGLIDSRRMNQEDFKIAQEWDAESHIEFGQVAFHDIKGNNTHYVILGPGFAEKAQELRMERFARMFEKRTWIKASEQ